MTIFPNTLTSDIDKVIISFLPPQNQIVLSGVNKMANQTLTNNYFKELFTRQYPMFTRTEESLDNKLISLIENYPNNCWKIACSILEMNKPVNEAVFKKDSIRETNRLNKKINEVESSLKEICGNYYADPSSPIHQAWEAYQNSLKKMGQTIETDILLDKYKKLDNKRCEIAEHLTQLKSLTKLTKHSSFQPFIAYVYEHLIKSSDNEDAFKEFFEIWKNISNIYGCLEWSLVDYENSLGVIEITDKYNKMKILYAKCVLEAYFDMIACHPITSVNALKAVLEHIQNKPEYYNTSYETIQKSLIESFQRKGDFNSIKLIEDYIANSK